MQSDSKDKRNKQGGLQLAKNIKTSLSSKKIGSANEKYTFGTLKPPKWDLRKMRIKEKE